MGLLFPYVNMIKRDSIVKLEEILLHKYQEIWYVMRKAEN